MSLSVVVVQKKALWKFVSRGYNFKGGSGHNVSKGAPVVYCILSRYLAKTALGISLYSHIFGSFRFGAHSGFGETALMC